MEHEATVRLSLFLILFAAFALAEHLAPRLPRKQSRQSRWFTNLSFSVLNTVTLRAMAIGLPLLAVGAAFDANTRGWGLLNLMSLPNWAAILTAILLMDLMIWFQHVMTHKIPLLWRLHRVHHADRDMDVTTAIRFHPVEIALSMLIKIGTVYALGAPPVAVILFEVLLNGSAMFNHANLRIAPRWDRRIRLVLVTPDMHRVHHSDQRHEHDTNFGFALSVWDRLFGTYTAQPAAGHDQMTVGLHWQDDRTAKLGWSLWLPFR